MGSKKQCGVFLKIDLFYRYKYPYLTIMETTKLKEQLRKAKIAFFLIVTTTVLSFVVVIRSVNSSSAVRIAASGLSMAIFLTLTTLVYLEILKLLKEIKIRSKNNRS
jgi:hypothetical protein